MPDTFPDATLNIFSELGRSQKYTGLSPLVAGVFGFLSGNQTQESGLLAGRGAHHNTNKELFGLYY